MSTDAWFSMSRTRRRLYEAPGEPADESIEPEVLPPVCRESPLDVDRNSLTETEEQARRQRANAIIRKYTVWSSVLDIIPMGWLGNGVVSGVVNMGMIRDLCACYGVEFKKQLAMAAVTAVVGGGINGGVIKIVGSGVSLLLPGAVGLLSMLTASASSGSISYLTGRVFIYHFELGGTLFDLDPGKTRAILLKVRGQNETACAG